MMNWTTSATFDLSELNITYIYVFQERYVNFDLKEE